MITADSTSIAQQDNVECACCMLKGCSDSLYSTCQIARSRNFLHAIKQACMALSGAYVSAVARASAWPSVSGSSSTKPSGVTMNSKNARPPCVLYCEEMRVTTDGWSFLMMGRTASTYSSCTCRVDQSLLDGVVMFTAGGMTIVTVPHVC